MVLTALGINHTSAPMAVRERVAFSPKHLTGVLHEMRQHVPINEAVLLSTCNRTEIYTDLQSNTEIYQWLQQHCGNSIDIRSHCYAHEGIECVRHVLRVASGLDSMVLGEPQILGQMTQYIKDFGNENGYDFIFGEDNTGTILYGKPTADITSEVIEFINQKYQGKN